MHQTLHEWAGRLDFVDPAAGRMALFELLCNGVTACFAPDALAIRQRWPSDSFSVLCMCVCDAVEERGDTEEGAEASEEAAEEEA